MEVIDLCSCFPLLVYMLKINDYTIVTTWGRGGSTTHMEKFEGDLQGKFCPRTCGLQRSNLGHEVCRAAPLPTEQSLALHLLLRQISP